MIRRVDRHAMNARLEKLLVEVDKLLTTKQEQDVINSCRRRLTGKLTVALIGRVSSGKSTLLNALIGDRVAMTDAGECTKVATLYTYYPQARTEVVGMDGERTVLSDIMHSSDLGRPADQIDYAIVYWYSRVLEREYRVIDTPGISSGFSDTTAQQATERAIIGFGSGLPKADVTVFMAHFSGVRTDELDFLRAMGANRHNTIFVLQKADMVGPGGLSAEDPFELAAGLAKKMATEHSGFTTAVIPVSAKLAEAAVMGVNKRDTEALAELADYLPVEMLPLIQHGDGDPERHAVVMRLITQMGEFGFNHGRAHAGDGAVALGDWLWRRSGLDDVRKAIDDRFVRCGPSMKALGVLTEISRLAPLSEDRRGILDALERAENADELHIVKEFAALDMLISWRPTHPLIAELDHVCMATTMADLLQLPDDTSPVDLEHAAKARQSDCQARKVTAMGSPATNALTVLEHSYDLARNAIRTTSA